MKVNSLAHTSNISIRVASKWLFLNFLIPSRVEKLKELLPLFQLAKELKST
jgi:hypothetical protein